MLNETDEKDLLMKALRIMGDIRYQVFTPEVTTIGLCPACGTPSRGAQLCFNCLTKELGYIVGSKAARDYLKATLILHEADLTVRQLAERGR